MIQPRNRSSRQNSTETISKRNAQNLQPPPPPQKPKITIPTVTSTVLRRGTTTRGLPFASPNMPTRRSARPATARRFLTELHALNHRSNALDDCLTTDSLSPPTLTTRPAAAFDEMRRQGESELTGWGKGFFFTKTEGGLCRTRTLLFPAEGSRAKSGAPGHFLPWRETQCCFTSRLSCLLRLVRTC